MAYKDSEDYGSYAPDDYSMVDPNDPNKKKAPTGQLSYTNPERPQVEPTTATGAMIPGPATGGQPAGGVQQWQSPQQFIQAWQASHPVSEGIQPLAEAIKAQFPDVSRFMYGATPSNNELLINGQKFKVLGAEGTPGQYWYQQGMDDSAPGAGRSPYAGGGGFDATSSIFGAGGDPRANKLFDLLMSRATAGLDANPDNPIIKRQVNAYEAAQTRAERNYESALAERLGANTNMGMERRMGAEKIGQATSGFQAQLIAQELAAERQQIESALSGAAGLLTSQQAMQLQERLAQLTLAQNSYQFDVNDEFRRSPLAS